MSNTSRKIEKLLGNASLPPPSKDQEGMLSDLLPPDERSEYKEFEESIADRVDQGDPHPFKELTNDELATLHTWIDRMRQVEQAAAS